jgi:hypothetical protein
MERLGEETNGFLSQEKKQAFSTMVGWGVDVNTGF